MPAWHRASNSFRSATATRAPGNGSARATSPSLHEIKARYAEWEIIGPPEIRDVDPSARYFSPHVKLRQDERAPELIDALEAFLVQLFLRRYVTYCARRGRFAAMNGAARLFAEVSASPGEWVAQKRQAPTEPGPALSCWNPITACGARGGRDQRDRGRVVPRSPVPVAHSRKFALPIQHCHPQAAGAPNSALALHY